MAKVRSLSREERQSIRRVVQEAIDAYEPPRKRA